MPDWLQRWLVRSIVLAVVAGLVWFLRTQLKDTEVEIDGLVQRVRLLEPPPPPPPPPKPIETRPPEITPQKEVKLNESDRPDDADDRGPADDRLGVDATGTGGSDAFGLVAKKGGTDLLATAKIGGGGRERYGYYASQIERMLEQILARDQELRRGSYSAVIRLWVDQSGDLIRFDLSRSTGDPAIDARLKEALAAAGALGLPPPQDLPQPIRLRVTSRVSG